MATPEQPRTGPEYFDGQAQRWPTLYESKPTFRDRLELFVGGIQQAFPKPARVLDFGCGPGVMSLALARLGHEVTGVDAAPAMIRQAEQERDRLGLSNASFFVMDATRSALAPGSFDAVICSSVLQYIEHDQRVLGDIAAALRPGGLLLISVPHAASFLGVAEAVSARLQQLIRSEGGGFLKFSLRLYSKRKFLQMLRRASMGSFRCTYFEFPLFGERGIGLSRLAPAGMLLLVNARREGGPSAGGRELVVRQAVSRKNLWKALPAPLKKISGGAAAWIPPAYILGWPFRKTRRLLGQAQWWPAQRSRDYQVVKLRELCRRAYARSVFYRRAFDAAGFDPDRLRTPEDLHALPTIDRDTVRDHLEEMCTESPRSSRIDYVSTGGTGGRPLNFYIGSDRSATEYAHLVAGWARVGYDPNLALAVIRGDTIRPQASGLRHEYDPLLRRHYYSNFHMTDDNMRRYLEHMQSIGPCYLHVYPSSAATLARFIERSGMKSPQNIRGILAGSENVYPEDRTLVERAFGVRLCSWYGHSEKLVLGAECEYTTDYHIWPTYGYFELLDEEGRPVTTPGQRGEIVGTGFINRIVPFIRYRTGDHATYVADRCPRCRREHPIIRDVRGHRSQEMLVAGDGSMISWTSINMHDDTFLHVRQFQFLQDRAGVASLRVVPGAGFGEEDVRRIERKLNDKLEGRLQFSIEMVPEIPLTASGKSTYVDQRIDIQHLASSREVLA